MNNYFRCFGFVIMVMASSFMPSCTTYGMGNQASIHGSEGVHSSPEIYLAWNPHKMLEEAGLSASDGDSNVSIVAVSISEIQTGFQLWSALVASEKDGMVRIFHVYKHPNLKTADTGWKRHTKVGALFVSERAFTLPIEKESFQRFVRETEWPRTTKLSDRVVLDIFY